MDLTTQCGDNMTTFLQLEELHSDLKNTVFMFIKNNISRMCRVEREISIFLNDYFVTLFSLKNHVTTLFHD